MSQEGAQVENVATATQEILRITVSDVLGLLAQGKSRKEIAEHYGKTQTEMQKSVWSHPKLKGRKIKKQYLGIELEDDTDEAVAEVTTDTVIGEIAHVPGPEANHAFENQEEMGTQEETPVTTEMVEETWR